MSIKDFETNGEKWNLEWSDQFDIDNWVSCEDDYDDENIQSFVKWCKLTCCRTTASMIQWKLGYSKMKQSNLKLKDLLEYNFFQIKMLANDKPFHIITIYDGYILQSWLRSYRLKIKKMDLNFIKLFEDVNKNWILICDVVGFSDNKCVDCVIYNPEGCLCKKIDTFSATFWVPE